MKFENTNVYNFLGAFRGMRNPLESWDRSDSRTCSQPYGECMGCDEFYIGRCYMDFVLGDNDLKLAQRLILAGDEHAKFMRQILVSVDITAPMFWWSEFDTYKVGTTANSTSKMHKLSSKPITLDCFETDDYDSMLMLNEYPTTQCNTSMEDIVEDIIQLLESLRLKYLETNDKRYWKELIRWLPESWLQTRTVTMSYANLRNMYFQRKNHKLTEWSVSFIDWINTLPYSEELIEVEGKYDCVVR